jgi:molecular chaperone GrpE (heat shock protein)
MSKSIDNIFDVESRVVTTTGTELSVVPTEDTIESDSTFARENLRDLILTATDALKEALAVAVNSESPRAYEVVSGLISTAAELNTKLLGTHAVQNRIASEGGVKTATQNNTTNNNVIFSGTPAELAKLLKDNS